MSGANNEHADVLSAMLRIAEGEIRGKDEQIALLYQMVATNEDEIRKKDHQIHELHKRVEAMQDEMDQFKGLFEKYLTKAEAARQTSAFARANASTNQGDTNGTDSNLPPPTAAALVGHESSATLGVQQHSGGGSTSSKSTEASRRALAANDDSMLLPASLSDHGHMSLVSEEGHMSPTLSSVPDSAVDGSMIGS
jgi:hypothetical protein